MAVKKQKKEFPLIRGSMTEPRAIPLKSNPAAGSTRARAGFYVIQKGCFQHADHRLAEILDCEGPWELIGRSFWDWVHPDDRARVRLVNGSIPFRCIKKDGTLVWVRMSGTNAHFNARPANIGCLLDLCAIHRIKEEEPVSQQCESVKISRWDEQNIIGQSECVRRACRLVRNLADLETAVLITGETGTGKELIAKALHFEGRRAAKPFISVHCSMLSERIMESELFGHVSDPFSTVSEKHGHVQTADGGTLFLDEIADIPPSIQLKLTRLLQKKTFERVGAAIPLKTDVRIVACSKKDLKRKVRSGTFREDLYHRLKAVEISMSPLRERMEDLPLLAEHFLQLSNHCRKTINGFSREVLAHLMAYDWPGNISELKYIIERAWILSNGTIEVAHLPHRIGKMHCSGSGTNIVPTHAPQGARDVLDALTRVYWNKTKAADLLGVSRQTLYRKMREYKLFEIM